jgi:hypothetical protein
MIQPQWPGLGPIFSPGTFGGTPYGGGTPGITSTGDADGVGSPWWGQNGTPTVGTASGSTGDTTSTMWNVLQQIMGLMGQLLSSVLGSVSGYGGLPGTSNGAPGVGTTPTQPNAPGGTQQRFADVDISSTGDPHLAETGTRETPSGTQTVDEHFDSMTGHDDLVSSRAIAGGYRVSTTVTQPNANGVTYNDSATVQANFGSDSVSMQHDGSFAITSGGQSVALAKGQTVTLAGGETVAENGDGSLVVSASNQQGGTIATTLRSNGSGVDVTTHAHELAVGGDVVHHGQKHHGHRPHVPVTPPVQPPVAAPLDAAAP